MGSICEKCGAKATHYICEVVRGARADARERQLCEACAEKEGFTRPSLAEVLEDAEEMGTFPEEFHEKLREDALEGLENSPLEVSAKVILEKAKDEAARLGHSHVGSEHILLALLNQPDDSIAAVLGQLETTIDDVRRVIKEVTDGA